MRSILKTLLLGSVCGCLMAASGIAAAQHRDDRHDWRHSGGDIRRDWYQQRRSTTFPRWRTDHRRDWDRHDNGRHLGWRIGEGNPHRAQRFRTWHRDDDRRHRRDWHHH